MQKSISEMAKFIKELIPTDTLEGYKFKPILEGVANDDVIRGSIASFKNFLHKLYDCLITEGDVHEKPLKKSNDTGHGVVSLSVGWPLINDITNVLIDIGYYGEITADGNLRISGGWQSLPSVMNVDGGKKKQNLSGPRMIEILNLLALCGMNFHGIDLNAQKIDFDKTELSEISYDESPAMLTGLKLMAIAHKDLSTSNDYYVFQRCDYRLLRDQPPDVTAILEDYIRLLPAKVQETVLDLHQHYLDAGLICKMKMHYFNVIFTYSHKNNAVWDLIPSPDGSHIFTKAKNMDKYAEDIKSFPLFLREKIAEGYGCEKKRFGKSCQKGCHGFRFALDTSILEISHDVKMWLDKEVSCLRK